MLRNLGAIVGDVLRTVTDITNDPMNVYAGYTPSASSINWHIARVLKGHDVTAAQVIAEANARCSAKWAHTVNTLLDMEAI